MAGYRPTAPPPNLEDALECTICLDTPVSPIHQCDNGHIVCGTCAGRMTACGLCKTKLQISILAERLSRQLDLKPSCPYSIAGCVTKISRAEMVSHQAKCYYRDVICEDPKWPPCDRVPIPFGDFFNHLHTNHQIDLDEINLGQFCDRTGIVLPVFGGDQFRDLEREQIVKLVKKNGQAFLLHCHIDTDLATFWMTVLGDEAEANKHWFQIKLGNENKTEAKKQNVAKCETTSTKVHPIVYAKPVRTNGAAVTKRLRNHFPRMEHYPTCADDDFFQNCLECYSSILVEDCIWFRPMGSKDYQYTAQLTIKNESTSGEMFIVWGVSAGAMTEDTFSVWPRVIPEHLLYTTDEIWSEDCSRSTKLYDFQGPDERKQIYQDIAKCSPSFFRYNLKVAVTDPYPPARKLIDFNIEKQRTALNNVERETQICYTIPVLTYHHHSKFDKAQMQHNCAMFPALLLRQVGMKRGADTNAMPLSFSYGIL